MARSPSGRRGRGPSDLGGTLGSLLRSTWEQAGAVREVIERAAGTGKARLDEALGDRKRTTALAELGEIVLELVRQGEIDLEELPEIRSAVKELERIDAAAEQDAPSDRLRRSRTTSRPRFDERDVIAGRARSQPIYYDEEVADAGAAARGLSAAADLYADDLGDLGEGQGEGFFDDEVDHGGHDGHGSHDGHGEPGDHGEIDEAEAHAGTSSRPTAVTQRIRSHSSPPPPAAALRDGPSEDQAPPFLDDEDDLDELARLEGPGDVDDVDGLGELDGLHGLHGLHGAAADAPPSDADEITDVRDLREGPGGRGGPSVPSGRERRALHPRSARTTSVPPPPAARSSFPAYQPRDERDGVRGRPTAVFGGSSEARRQELRSTRSRSAETRPGTLRRCGTGNETDDTSETSDGTVSSSNWSSSSRRPSFPSTQRVWRPTLDEQGSSGGPAEHPAAPAPRAARPSQTSGPSESPAPRAPDRPGHRTTPPPISAASSSSPASAASLSAPHQIPGVVRFDDLPGAAALEPPAPTPASPFRSGGISFDDDDLEDYMHPDDVPPKPDPT